MDKSRVEFEEWFFEDLKVVADYDLSWQAWQASRKALVVELPTTWNASFTEKAIVMDASSVVEALKDAGVAYK